MNNFTNSNLKETIINILQELQAERPNFFTNQLKILSWKSKKINGALITKVNGQRYLGLLRKDMRGQEYWKYKPLTNSPSEPSGEEKEGVNNSELSQKESSTPPPNSADNRTEPAKNYDQSKSVNNE